MSAAGYSTGSKVTGVVVPAGGTTDLSITTMYIDDTGGRGAILRTEDELISYALSSYTGKAIIRFDLSSIPEDATERIFELFYRRSERARGTGIGLAVVRDLVKLHGGRVEARNAEGAGAVFTVHVVTDSGADAADAPQPVAARAR